MAIDLSKEMARIARLQEKREAILDPNKKVRTPGLGTSISEVERIQRQQERARKDFVKWVMEQKNEVLKEEVEDYGRIVELMPVSEAGIEQAREVINSYENEKARLEAELYLLEQKKAAAEKDIDILTDAVSNFREFEAAVKEYALSVIEGGEQFDPEEIITLWDEMMSEEEIDALNRGTTTFNSLDWIFGQVKSQFQNDAAEAMRLLKTKVEILFVRYGIADENE